MIGQCGETLTEPGTYIVNQTLTGGGLGSCITIAGSYITLTGTAGGGIDGSFQDADVTVLPGGYTNIVLSGLILVNSYNSGVLINAANYTSFGTPFSDQISVINNTITAGDEGVWILGCTGCVVDGNTITPYPGAQITPDSGMVIDGATDIAISNNVVTAGYRTAAVEFVDLNIRAEVSRNRLIGAGLAGAIGTVHNGDLRQSRIYNNEITGEVLGIYWTHMGGVSQLNAFKGDMGIEFYQNSIVGNVISTPFCIYLPAMYSPLEYPMWDGNVEVGASHPQYAKVFGNYLANNVCAPASVSNFGNMNYFVPGRMYDGNPSGNR